MILEKGKVNVIIDGQWGSTGKGKLAGWLCENERPDMCVCDFMPNAGHTFVDANGVDHVFTQLPVGLAFGIPCLLGPHCAINLDNLRAEMARYTGANQLVKIHPLVVVIDQDDRDVEQIVAGRIANTAKGGYSATVRKIMRGTDVQLISNYVEFKHLIADTHLIAQAETRRGATVLAETAQGFDLGLHHGWTYPHVAGRDCLLGRAFDNAGVSPRYLGSVIMSLRTFPIRVGNTDIGQSGPFYPDQKELSWEAVGQPPEQTTVTKRVRRVFTFSWEQLNRACTYLEPSHAFLNFVNYLDAGVNDTFVEILRRKLKSDHGCHLSLLGTGPGQDEMVISGTGEWGS